MKNIFKVTKSVIIIYLNILLFTNSCLDTAIKPDNSYRTAFFINNTTNDTVLATITFYNQNHPVITNILPRENTLLAKTVTDTMVKPSLLIKQMTFSIFNENYRLKEQLQIDTINNADWLSDTCKNNEQKFCYPLKKDTVKYYFVKMTTDSMVLKYSPHTGLTNRTVLQYDTILLWVSLYMGSEIQVPFFRDVLQIIVFDGFGNPLGFVNLSDTNWNILNKNERIFIYN